MTVRKALSSTFVFFLGLAAGSAHAQAPKAPAPYPAKSVRIIVGYAPGGATDIVGRLVAEKLAGAMGQSFFVENRPGASATIASEMVARSAPDGYTLLIAATTSHSILPSLMKLPYDAQRDFAPVSQLVTSPLLLALHPSLPVRSVPDLIKLARARPGQLTFGAGGTGTPPHLAGEFFKQMTSVDMLYVPYKGEGPAIIDLVGGQISLIFSNVVAVLPQVEAKRLRGIAVTSPERLPSLPDFPTVAESGVPGFSVESWFGLVGPPGMSAEVVSRLNAETVRGMGQPDLREKLARQGLFVVTGTPKELIALMQRETEKWAKVVKAAGIKIE